MVVYDSKRRPIHLGQDIGRGGEAIVYQVAGQPGLLAKTYDPPRPDYGQKLAWMQAHPPNDPTRAQGHASIAWPLELLYDGRGRFAGYLMPYIQNAVKLLEVFNPHCRAETLPDFDGRYLHRTARNLASALGALHAHDYVVGDLNESNVMVAPSALVTLIDTDSFQVQEEQSGGRLSIYPCPVGKLEYTPRELQGKDPRRTQRHPEHDGFGLGVLIFQLLMGGSHPFRCRWLGGGDPPPVEVKIARGWFPHVKSPAGPVAPPRNVPTLDTLHPRVADLMRRCFVDGHQDPQRRPMPAMWVQALEEAEKALVACRQGHYYSNHLRACPYCGAGRASVQVPLSPRRMVSTVPTAPASFQPTRQPAASSPTTVACPNCGQVNAATEIYCQRCAYPLSGTQPCPRCGRPVPQGVRYCPACGNSVPVFAMGGASPATSPSFVTCPSCGQANSAAEIYCQRCGQQLAGNRWCPHCGQSIPSTAPYCNHCGKKV